MQPLAERMRPKTLEDYVGQESLIKDGAVLRQALETGRILSFILWGPPGVGKTTLAKIISQQLQRPFFELSAINSGVKDIRETIAKAKNKRFFNQPNPILFIDEIHRFSKSQQDALLGAVEQGIITLIGATTENPSFEVIPALLSRCQVYTLEHLSKEQLIALVEKALATDEILKDKDIQIQEYDALLRFSGGDGRKLYNLLELVTNTAKFPLVITDELVKEKAQQSLASYDKNGEMHYDIISAFIKSIRGSDPNAAVYWLARMIEGGEDLKFIARRLIISASEDIGLANPNALLMANTAFQAATAVGFPEARIILSQATIYLATSPKSNASYMAINNAQRLVKQTGNLPVPLALRNAPTKLMQSLGYGDNYKYSHDFPNNFAFQEFMPEQLSNTNLYQTGKNPAEDKIKQRMEFFWKDKYGF